VPTYDYQCRSCGTVTEVIHSMLEDGPTVCERCGGELRRVMHATGIIFRGSGFYKTDSRSGAGDKATAAPSASKASGDGSGTASSGSDAKSDASGSSSGSSDASAGSSTGNAD
jgi:putative FmdB family regulatory protein